MNLTILQVKTNLLLQFLPQAFDASQPLSFPPLLQLSQLLQKLALSTPKPLTRSPKILL